MTEAAIADQWPRTLLGLEAGANPRRQSCGAASSLGARRAANCSQSATSHVTSPAVWRMFAEIESRSAAATAGVAFLPSRNESTDQGILNCLTGGHLPHQCKKCPTSVLDLPHQKFYLMFVIYNIISLNFWTLTYDLPQTHKLCY